MYAYFFYQIIILWIVRFLYGEYVNRQIPEQNIVRELNIDTLVVQKTFLIF